MDTEPRCLERHGRPDQRGRPFPFVPNLLVAAPEPGCGEASTHSPRFAVFGFSSARKRAGEWAYCR